MGRWMSNMTLFLRLWRTVTKIGKVIRLTPTTDRTRSPDDPPPLTQSERTLLKHITNPHKKEQAA